MLEEEFGAEKIVQKSMEIIGLVQYTMVTLTILNLWKDLKNE
jgi:hypothetical protein